MQHSNDNQVANDKLPQTFEPGRINTDERKPEQHLQHDVDQ